MTMLEFFRSHKKSTWAGFVVLGLVAGIGIFLALFDWNLLRPALERRLTVQTGHRTGIDGNLRVHLWSWEPSAEVQDLHIDNPHWADRPTLFTAKRITISVSLGNLLRGHLVIPQLDVVEPILDLERDADDRANWQFGAANRADHGPAQFTLPPIRNLTIERGELRIVDRVRKLRLNGSLAAAERAGNDDPAAFKVRCDGSLNARPFKLRIDGEPLINVDPGKPYSFKVHLTAADVTLDTHATIRKPFDWGGVDAGVVVSGDDLADIFYLTGLALPNTPHYRLAANLHVDGAKYTLDDVQGRLGSSDIEGKIRIDAGSAKPKLEATLRSDTLDMADLAPTLGKPIAKSASLSSAPSAHERPTPPARSPPPARPVDPAAPPGTVASPATAALPATARLLPDADLQVKRVRGMNADVTYHAGAVTMPKIPMKEVGFHLVLNDGLMTLDPLAFVLDQGRFSGRAQIDARKDEPLSQLDMRIQDVDLAQFKAAKMRQPPLEGKLQGRFRFTGTGTSVRKFAASSDGVVSVVIPHGQINDAIAELTGINVLRGLGLLLAKGQQNTEIRCGIIDFKDQRGQLATTTVYLDTTNVLITGRGGIDLATEKIDLALQGKPKKLRFLRLRSPISLHGTLLDPGVGLEAGKLTAQAGVAAALGALLTPVGAALAFIDPGLAKDKDCGTLLSQANAGVRTEMTPHEP